jgi:AcrR family transcriptional regulator
MVKRSPKRRRGKALEEAILDAAWDELGEHGYALFTLEAVANRAGTSRPVLARRWPNRAELAVAAWRCGMLRTAVGTPNKGSLRSDLISLLREFSVRRTSLLALLSLHLGEGLWPGQTLGDVRLELLRGSVNPLDEIIARAVERGEVDPARLTPRIQMLPLDLLRHEVIMTTQPVPDGTILEIVDEIFLPLVAAVGSVNSILSSTTTSKKIAS